ncbi:Helix-turn-helix transcriptional regulator [Rhodovastum atsumiense]|uniref:Helix-turn-helix transcriptional regulator n=1 Tax=Rhodovastum atsumiense TaxID=504468 RepID=A0A5M6IZ99_9PROT|nr:helix-turn-helix transcriptional regulator [Rhodovastum atsumiense]KAA5612678.1 helix-turn-helix transcriptional regulator [Rhodovastum atsumiense]CAH2602780.1 Helix-turn-helix transcriptional regulator [Rhodovastum atsumiense]
MDTPSAAGISDLIGGIYDCALDPDTWPEAMRRICEALDCIMGRLMVVDLRRGALRFGRAWNEPPGVAEIIASTYRGDVVAAVGAAMGDATHDPDEPYVLSRKPGGVNFLSGPVARDWATPSLGWCDALNAIVLRDAGRVGVFAVVRHIDTGVATRREIAMMRRLIPHLRRAVAIGDLLEMRRLENAALAGSLDGLAVGIGILDRESNILHANLAARRMMEQDGPIHERGGKLCGGRLDETAALRSAVAASDDEAGIGRAGLGVPLGGPADLPALAHVLPLRGSEHRRRLLPRAAAAIFVTPPARDHAEGLAAVASRFRLTPAEARLLGHLAAGTGLALAGRALGITEATAKTHLARIFAKTATSRQAELVALVSRLVPPV